MRTRSFMKVILHDPHATCIPWSIAPRLSKFRLVEGCLILSYHKVCWLHSWILLSPFSVSQIHSIRMAPNLRYRRLAPALRHRDIFLLQPMGFGAEGRWKPSSVNPCFRISRYQKGVPWQGFRDFPWMQMSAGGGGVVSCLVHLPGLDDWKLHCRRFNLLFIQHYSVTVFLIFFSVIKLFADT